ncbi:hypothetical protein PP515_gp51 [Gordonia phage Sidious]|uniref:Uncharacterized protein n=1 Tax=Gordonia phage Sidious TaxID=2591118 RepID=A0A515MIB1_9CAUD|nr:hypothetical protein PP515_gp51 [Gordonia phage Sidious]QDM56398.1 hypothetical protein SEA_SIDIOUS_51 [Gordonia phage Sidious]
MNTVLDIVLVRTPPTATSLLFAVIFWGAVIVSAASYVPRVAGWLTDNDLDDESDDPDDSHLRIVRGEIA